MAKHVLYFYSKRSTPEVVKVGNKPNPKPEYGTKTSSRLATEEEEKIIARGEWLRVDEKGKKGGQEGYKKTKMKGREHLVHSAEQELADHIRAQTLIADALRTPMSEL